MKVSELRNKSTIELEKLVKDMNKNLSDIRFKSSVNQLKNVKDASKMKKDIAKILTIVKEKEIKK